MALRDLEYNQWEHDPARRKVRLFDKRTQDNIVLSMAMADSFCRAMIGFKEDQRRYDKNVLRKIMKGKQDRFYKRLARLNRRIDWNKK
jgi:hypothetical protein